MIKSVTSIAEFDFILGPLPFNSDGHKANIFDSVDFFEISLRGDITELKGHGVAGFSVFHHRCTKAIKTVCSESVFENFEGGVHRH